MVTLPEWEAMRDCVEWGHLSTWMSQVSPKLLGKVTVGWVAHTGNIDMAYNYQ